MGRVRTTLMAAVTVFLPLSIDATSAQAETRESSSVSPQADFEQHAVWTTATPPWTAYCDRLGYGGYFRGEVCFTAGDDGFWLMDARRDGYYLRMRAKIDEYSWSCYTTRTGIYYEWQKCAKSGWGAPFVPGGQVLYRPEIWAKNSDGSYRMVYSDAWSEAWN